MTLADYFDSPAVICPYARITRKVYFADQILTPRTIGEWIDTVGNRDVAITIASECNRKFEIARLWAYWTLGHIKRISHGETQERDGLPLPFLTIGNLTTYTIGMGPQYPVEHPRYAPTLCLVTVNEAAIREVPVDKRIPIQREMQRRSGVVYDADRIWLDLQPTVKESAMKESAMKEEAHVEG